MEELTRPDVVVRWPAEASLEYVAAGYWRQRPLGSCMWDWADEYGTRIALVDRDTRLSYTELAEHADALAEGMAGHGIGPGGNVLVQLPNRWEFFVVLLACQRLGVAPVLALPAHREHELLHLARTARAAAVIVPDTWHDFDHQELAARVAANLPDRPRVLVVGDRVRPGHIDVRGLLAAGGDRIGRRRRLDAVAPAADDVALFLLSGGTTGLPKIINRTHNDYEYNARRSAEVCGFGEDTVYLAVLPVAHNFALGSPGVLGTLGSGGRAVLLPSPEPHAAFATMVREGVTVTSLVPAVVRRWLATARAAGFRPPGRPVLQVGGSVLEPRLASQIGRVLGCRLQQVFGMAEGLLNYTRLDDADEIVLTTQGRPISPADEISIVDPSGAPAAPGASGELLTRGPYTPRGYYAAPEHNRRAFVDGWYRTGDVVRLHPSGNLAVEGRVKDLINRGGEKISAEEIESLVGQLVDVHEVAAVPVPDDELGERIGIVVVPRPGRDLTLAMVRDRFRTRGVAGFKIPDYLVTVTDLPRTPIGKIDKKMLSRNMTAHPLLKKGSTMPKSAKGDPPLRLNGVHHHAYVTWRPEETVAFYRDALGLPLVHAVSATGWLSDDFPDFLHFFFALGRGDHLAFFYYFGVSEDTAPTALMRKSRHIAFDVETEEEMHVWRRRLKSHGIKVTPPLTHELVESIYFDDPNGIQLEIARPLRAFTEIDARDAELTVQALLDVVKEDDPSLYAVWRRKAELLRGRLGVTR